jgi:Na+-driven multidrug efflux pump
MWATGIACMNQCYSTLGYDVVSANNICQTFYNVFGVAFMAVGASIAIILGQMLGAGKLDEAKDASLKLISFSVFVSAVVSVVYFICASFIPNFYNTTNSVRTIAMGLMRICALTMPLEAMAHASYFTLRSGGRIFITMLFDSGFVWAVSLPFAFILSSFSGLSVLYVYAICQSLNLIKCIAGAILVQKGIWLRNMVA